MTLIHRKLLMTIACSLVLLLSANGVGPVLGDESETRNDESPQAATDAEDDEPPANAPVPPVCSTPPDLAATLDPVLAGADLPPVAVAEALSQHDPCMVVGLVQDLLTCETDEDCRCLFDILRDLIDDLSLTISETVTETTALVEDLEADLQEVASETAAIPEETVSVVEEGASPAEVEKTVSVVSAAADAPVAPETADEEVASAVAPQEGLSPAPVHMPVPEPVDEGPLSEPTVVESV